MQVTPSSIAGNSGSSSQVSPPASQSSTVGSFGSFWLPGEASANSDRGSTSNHNHQAGGNSQGKSSEGTDRTLTNLKQTLNDARGPTKQAVPKSRDKALSSPKPKSTVVNHGDSKKSSKLSKPNQHPTRLQAHINRGPATVRPTESLSSKTLIKTRNSMQESSASEKGDKHVNPDQQGDANDGRRRGAKGATHASVRDSISTKSSIIASERFEFQGIADEKANSPISSPSVPSLTGSVSVPENLRPVLPVIAARVAVFSRDGRRVARFALDLPGGGKLGVKVELTGKKVLVAFITSDQELRKSLRSGSGPIADSLAAFGFNCEGCLVASSYHELEDSVSKAA